jgi:cobalt/nickel transport system ATP-binding protein
MTTIFELTGVHYAYRDSTAIDGLSLTIERGQRMVLLGANGSGKSTLLRLLDGLYFPNRGDISAFGEPLSAQRMEDEEAAFAFRRRVGLVFQNADVQLFNPTVFDELAFGLLQLGLPRSEIRNRVETSLKNFSIEHLKDRAPHRLSGGEKKRVALASVLILEPEVLLLDEPTAALDPQSACEIVDFLMQARGSGRTVITATHDLDIVEDIADYCVVLQSGRIAGIGTPDEILTNVDLLTRTRLVHAHRHAHGRGQPHSHHHLHRREAPGGREGSEEAV